MNHSQKRLAHFHRWVSSPSRPGPSLEAATPQRAEPIPTIFSRDRSLALDYAERHVPEAHPGHCSTLDSGRLSMSRANILVLDSADIDRGGDTKLWTSIWANLYTAIACSIPIVIYDEDRDTYFRADFQDGTYEPI